MTPGRVADLEHVAGLDAQGRGHPLQHVQVDAPGPVVLEVVHRGLPDPHELGQLDLSQAPFVAEGLNAEL